jgi:hypothetical protein
MYPDSTFPFRKSAAAVHAEATKKLAQLSKDAWDYDPEAAEEADYAADLIRHLARKYLPGANLTDPSWWTE